MGNPEAKFSVISPDHPERAAIEQFIKVVFMRTYRARVKHFARVLLGVKGDCGEWVAALGFTSASSHDLFVENYGGGSVEQQISNRLDTPVTREQIVEVGNLAATGAGAARMLITNAIAYLYQQGFSWVIFTATRAVLNSFSRLDLQPIILATADPERLPDQGRSWGSYYKMKPQIMAGNILLGYLSMESRSCPMAEAGA
ncbi:MAG: thermostable hemolysin [Sulfuricellaceae bacterium]|nr:thermostable hemolysin [Sulfuricellaceae bacterium]